MTGHFEQYSPTSSTYCANRECGSSGDQAAVDTLEADEVVGGEQSEVEDN